MSYQLKKIDIIALGFMLCSFFLGAGNIIFPPAAGLQAGNGVAYATIGFLLTGVGLPLLGVLGLAVSGGSLNTMTRFLPKSAVIIAMVVLFIVIGPAFATPRTSLVAWDLAVKPLIEKYVGEATSTHQLVSTTLFFIIATLFACSRGSLIDSIGKILTPFFFLLLIVLAVGVIFQPWDIIREPVEGAYQEHPLTQGFLDGYNTMDALAAMMFGSLIIDILRKKGITDTKKMSRYLGIAGLIAAFCLSIAYLSLFMLGVTADNHAISDPASGTLILSSYIHYLFGSVGIYFMSAVVYLACLTTAIGLLGACADYFSQQFKALRLNYIVWVIIFSLISAYVANMQLKTLIKAAIPCLYILYPMVIAMLVLTFLARFMHHPAFVYRLVMSVSLFIGVLAALQELLHMHNSENLMYFLGLPVIYWHKLFALIQLIPLASIQLEWIVPMSVTLIIAFIIDRKLLNREKHTLKSY